jgi:hypothetical protein
MPRSKSAARRAPAVPTIVCVNYSKQPLGVGFGALIRALQKFLDEHFAPVWGTPAKLAVGNEPRKGAWTMAFLDNAGHAKSLGMHRAEYRGMPIAKVFVKKTLRYDEQVSVVASHELAEMMADPGLSLWAKGPGGLYCYEVCDAVEEEKGFSIDGVPMSDFVHPAYFQTFRKSPGTRFDHLGRVKRPFEIRSGGYSVIRRGKRLVTKHGSAAKKRRFAREDRQYHRSEYRR